MLLPIISTVYSGLHCYIYWNKKLLIRVFSWHSSFDTIWHNGFLFKLKTILTASYYLQLKSCLNNRIFRIKLKMSLSTTHKRLTSVPQESDIAPFYYNFLQLIFLYPNGLCWRYSWVLSSSQYLFKTSDKLLMYILSYTFILRYDIVYRCKDIDWILWSIVAMQLYYVCRSWVESNEINLTLKSTTEKSVQFTIIARNKYKLLIFHSFSFTSIL